MVGSQVGSSTQGIYKVDVNWLDIKWCWIVGWSVNNINAHLNIQDCLLWPNRNMIPCLENWIYEHTNNKDFKRHTITSSKENASRGQENWHVVQLQAVLLECSCATRKWSRRYFQMIAWESRYLISNTTSSSWKWRVSCIHKKIWELQCVHELWLLVDLRLVVKVLQ